jgi:hypothetical protein
MHRNPKEIADDLKTLREGAKLAFVPLDVVKAVDLMVEFAGSTAAALDAAGIIETDTGATVAEG